MCLAVPARIVELKDDKAVVDALGNRWNIRTTLTPEVKMGDIVLIHAGFAIAKVNEKDAKQTWQLVDQIDGFQQKQEPAGRD